MAGLTIKLKTNEKWLIPLEKDNNFWMPLFFSHHYWAPLPSSQSNSFLARKISSLLPPSLSSTSFPFPTCPPSLLLSLPPPQLTVSPRPSASSLHSSALWEPPRHRCPQPSRCHMLFTTLKLTQSHMLEKEFQLKPKKPSNVPQVFSSLVDIWKSEWNGKKKKWKDKKWSTFVKKRSYLLIFLIFSFVHVDFSYDFFQRFLYFLQPQMSQSGGWLGEAK